MKKTLCMLLIVSILFTLIPMVVFAVPEGTAITTSSELYNMADNGTYYLANDIYIEGDWNYRATITGTTLDGNGYTIYYKDGVTIHGGLFREVNGITVKNLNIVQLGNVTYIGKDDGGEVSPLIRRVVGGTVTVTDVNVYANMRMVQANTSDQGGGIISQISKAATVRLTRCIFSGSITKEHADNNGSKGVAGILGGNWGDVAINVYMNNCINYGDISSKNNAGGFFGGWRGNSNTSSSAGFRTFEIINCINYGDITSNADAGGFLGYYNTNPGGNNNFRFNINYGKITSTASSGRVGGFAGCIAMPANNASYTLYGLVNYGALSGTSYVQNAVGSLTINGSVTRNNNTNFGYTNDHNKGTSGSGTDLITDDAAACEKLNTVFKDFGGSYTLLPNGKITLAWAKDAGYDEQAPGYIDATLVGVQLSGGSGDLSRNVRFVCGLGENVSDLTKVGVKIVAKDANGNQLKVFEGDTDTVYESILADGEAVYAEEFGKTYFYTAVIEGVPTDLGEIVFEVRTFQQTTGGTVTYGGSKPITVDMGDLPEEYLREGWTLLAPAYEGGTLAAAQYDAGTGIDKDTGSASADRAYMMCITDTTEAEFDAYCNKLVACGYVVDGESTLKGADGENNLYRGYRYGNKLIYTYFNHKTKETRVIVDSTGVSESTFEYSFATNASTQTDVYLYGMKYTEDDEGTPDNGAFYVIKQADNSVILIDGGGSLQSTDAAKAELWRFLKEITGVGANEKVTVACWFITHPHEDHYKLAYDVLAANNSQIDLQRVMFNFPNPTEIGVGIYEFRGNLQNYYPDVMFLKCHTGQSIRLGGIDIDILLTHEDLVDAKTGKSDIVEVQEGNMMTTVARFTLPDGTVFLNLGDLEEEAEEVWFADLIDESEIKCDIVTIAHHGYNKVQDTYKAAKATYALWPNNTADGYSQGFFGIGAHWKYSRSKDIISWLKSANGNTSPATYYAGKNTAKLACVNGTITATLTNPVY